MPAKNPKKYAHDHYVRNKTKYKKRSAKWRTERDSRYNEIVRQYRSTPRGKAKTREYHLRHEYGITLARYEELYEMQRGECMICWRPSKRLHVDHDHTTGDVRGLLCGNCNKAIGLLSDSIEIVLRACAYLESAACTSREKRTKKVR